MKKIVVDFKLCYISVIAVSPLLLGHVSALVYEAERDIPIVDIGAYVLMDNHFHILIKEKDPIGISVFMHKITTAYTMYFNLKNERSGSLFQGTFKAKHISEDMYLKYLHAYIHLNPIKMIQPGWKEEGIRNINTTKDFLNQYRYSSYNEFTGALVRREKGILNLAAFPDYFRTKQNFRGFIEEWLEVGYLGN